jgi:DNA-directed RNA polymerase specialized sigma24 family protein
LQLRYTQGMDHRHIAEQLKMSANNVGVLLHRLRKSLRECVERRLDSGAQSTAGGAV